MHFGERILSIRMRHRVRCNLMSGKVFEFVCLLEVADALLLRKNLQCV